MLKPITVSDNKKQLAEEVAKIDSQMAALAERKHQCLSELPKGYSRKMTLGGVLNGHNGEYGVEIGLRGEESHDSLVEAMAEAIVYLGERGLLPLKNEPIPALPDKAQKPDLPNEKPLKNIR